MAGKKTIEGKLSEKRCQVYTLDKSSDSEEALFLAGSFFNCEGMGEGIRGRDDRVEEGSPLSFASVKRAFVGRDRGVFWGDWAIGGDPEYPEVGDLFATG